MTKRRGGFYERERSVSHQRAHDSLAATLVAGYAGLDDQECVTTVLRHFEDRAAFVVPSHTAKRSETACDHTAERARGGPSQRREESWTRQRRNQQANQGTEGGTS